MSPKDFVEKVKKQYEEYPYPMRNPEDEKINIRAISMDGLDKINFYCFGAQRDFTKNTRMLVAGGGTGDSAIFLAEQLEGTDAEIVYLDLSQASMKIAQQRAEIRQLKNITWVNASILDIPTLNLGTFDYINCFGVLHHLADPQKGLAALNSVLKDDGTIAIMVYAKYGRMAVYQLQELMRFINQEEENLQVQIDNCRDALASLNPIHWFNEPNDMDFINETKVDVGIYDLLLHSTDRAYSIPELYGFVESAGLQVTKLLTDREVQGNLLYSPSMYIKNQRLLNKVRELPEKQQHAIAELLHGRIKKHIFYAARSKVNIPSDAIRYYVPCFSILSEQSTAIKQIIQQISGEPQGIEITTTDKCRKFRLQITKYTKAFAALIDNKRTVTEIIRTVQESTGYTVPEETLFKEFVLFLMTMRTNDWIYVRAPHVPPYKTTQDMKQRMAELYSSSSSLVTL